MLTSHTATKAEKFSLADYSVNDAANGIYADVYMPKNAMGGNYVIDAKAAPVKLGTFTFEVVDKAAFEALTANAEIRQRSSHR